MSKVYTHEDIGYSSRTGAAYVAGSTSSVNADGKLITLPQDTNRDTTPYAKWGSNNLQPHEMAKLISDCGVLNSALDGKARLTVGKGIMPFLVTGVDSEGKEIFEFVNDNEINDWLELNDSFNFCYLRSFDKHAYGWTAAQMILSRNRQRINRIKRTDVVTARLEKQDKYGVINNMYLCGDWCRFSSWNEEYMRSIPILEEGNELEALRDGKAFEYAFIDRLLMNGHSYYPQTLWWSARAWVKIAISIPAMKEAMFNNQMTIKYLVTISDQYFRRVHQKWDTYTPEKRKEVRDDKMDEIDEYLVGQENQYKSIFTGSYVDPVTKVEVQDIKITVIDDKVKDGKLIPDGAAAVNEILFALMMNPALMGTVSPGGMSTNNGGSNIREALLTQIMLLEPERRMNGRLLNVVADFNGWKKRYASKGRLVFRYPAGILTTLDTGKSTKSEIV